MTEDPAVYLWQRMAAIATEERNAEFAALAAGMLAEVSKERYGNGWQENN